MRRPSDRPSGRTSDRRRSDDHLAGRGTGAAGRGLSAAGLRTGAAGRALAEHRSWTTGLVIGAAALNLVLWNHPTVGAVALVVCVALAVLIILEMLAATATLTRPG
ncbi:hypothetical protein [Streptomyces sp. SudanB52_2052]|uniref:hypothetical protein n=1 Tax=Streptomyces sp. SudanB52_2052 TaxID=3035276 RepID=UPI003F559116